jgi:hypothetical protein
MIAVIFRIGRAAIDAPEIAPIRDRNAQVRNLPPKFIVKRHRCRRSIGGLALEKQKPESVPWMSGTDEKAYIFVALLSKHGRPRCFHPNPHPRRRHREPPKHRPKRQ